MRQFGRVASPDPRDSHYLMVYRVPSPFVIDVPESMEYVFEPVLDQKDTFYCVGYAWTHWLVAPPVLNTGLLTPAFIYKEAKKLDGLPPETDGTTVRAGAQVLMALGYIQEYIWTWSAQVLATWLLRNRGPVVIGSAWYDTMSNANGKCVDSLEGFVGGHAWLVSGYDSRTECFTGTNSWGPDWAEGGRFHLTFDVMAQLLSDGGEACTAVENATSL